MGQENLPSKTKGDKQEVKGIDVDIREAQSQTREDLESEVDQDIDSSSVHPKLASHVTAHPKGPFPDVIEEARKSKLVRFPPV